jgi:tetratricopeptide (TPR) repeat protein
LNDIGECQVAFRAAKIVVRRHPDLWLAHQFLGMWALDLEDLTQPVESLSTAVRLRSQPHTLTFLGLAYARQNKVEQAVVALRQALEIDENYDEASYNLATLLVESDPVEAKSLFRSAIHGDPDYGLAHRELGILLKRQGGKNREEAETHLRRATELLPDDPWAHIHLGNWLYGQGRLHQALDAFKDAARVAPAESTPLWTAADIYYALGDVQTAIAFNQRALEIDPDEPAALTNMGRCMMNTGDLPTARRYLENALAIDSDRELTRRLVAELEKIEDGGA